MTDATTAPTTKLTKDITVRTFYLDGTDEIVYYDDADHTKAFRPKFMDVKWVDGKWERSIIRGPLIDAGIKLHLGTGDGKATWRWSDGDAPEWVQPQLTDDVLSGKLQQEIKNSFSRMPYAGGLYVGAGFETVAGLVEKLDALAATLRHVGNRERAMDEELTSLRRQKTAIGEFLLSAVESAADQRDRRERAL